MPFVYAVGMRGRLYAHLLVGESTVLSGSACTCDLCTNKCRSELAELKKGSAAAGASKSAKGSPAAAQAGAKGGAAARTPGSSPDGAAAELSKMRKEADGLKAANAALQGQAEERLKELQVQLRLHCLAHD